MGGRLSERRVRLIKVDLECEEVNSGTQRRRLEEINEQQIDDYLIFFIINFCRRRRWRRH